MSDISKQLTEAAHARVVRNITSFGNSPNALHQKALREVCRGLSELAFGEIKGRYAFPLDVGCGKTQTAVAWIAEAHRLEHLGADISVAVAASQISALAELREELLRNDVPEEYIGLIHSKRNEPGLPESEEAPQSKPVLLISHERARMRERLRQFNTYERRDRSLLIWDESLLVGNCATMFLHNTLSQAVSALADEARRKPHLRELLDYLKSAKSALGAELSRQAKRRNSEPRLVRLDEIGAITLERYKEALRGCGVIGSDLLLQLLDVSGMPLRPVQGIERGDGVVLVEVEVPAEIRNIAVLDASYPIRKLAQEDPSVTLWPGFSGDGPNNLLRQIKRYDNVTVHLMQGGHGRRSTSRDFRGDKKLAKDITKVVQGLPADEAVLFFTFKPRGSDRDSAATVLQRTLADAEVDLDATWVTPDGEAKHRFVFRTWGQETSVSAYKYCKHVVCAGVIVRDSLEVYGAILGQINDPTAKLGADRVKAAVMGEITHSLYQAMGRGACRVVRDGQAGEMHLWVALGETSPLRDLIQLCQGLSVEQWEGDYGKAKGETKAAALAVDIIRHLRSLEDGGVFRASVKKVKAAVTAQGVGNKTWETARDLALQHQGWRVEKQTLVKATAQDYGFQSWARVEAATW